MRFATILRQVHCSGNVRTLVCQRRWAIAATARAGNNHTLNGQDTNNFAPRTVSRIRTESNRLVVRGGFGGLL